MDVIVVLLIPGYDSDELTRGLLPIADLVPGFLFKRVSFQSVSGKYIATGNITWEPTLGLATIGGVAMLDEAGYVLFHSDIPIIDVGPHDTFIFPKGALTISLT